MVHRIVVEDQSLRWYGRPPRIADDSIEFVQLQFHLPEEWASLLLVAQFTQADTYNMLMDGDRCFLPKEITAGLCKVSLFGYAEGKPLRATSIPLVFQIEESGFVSSAETPIPPTPDLYAQLIEYFSSIAGSGGGGSGGGTINPEDIAAAVEDYLSKNPPEVPDLSDEVERAETAAQRAESANSSAQAALSGAAGAASDANTYAQQAKGFSDSASGSAGYANTRANEADAAASKAEEAASDAEAAADRAEEAAKVTTDLDTTLTQEGKAADAKAVGDAISKLSGGNVAYDEEQELTEEQKAQARANIGAQPVGEYLTEVPEGYAKNEDIKKVDRKVDTLQEVVSKFHSNIVETASGEVIQLSDSSDLELAGLRIFGKTTQNGTPTPDAPVPLESIGKSVSVMVCGKNMLDVSQFTNGSQLTITNGAITVTTSNDSIAVNTGKKLAELAPSLEVGKNYILTLKTTGTSNKIFLYHANTVWDSNSALSITQKHLDSTVFLYASGKSTTATITDMMIRFASASDASYEPYKEIQNLTVSVPNHLCGIPVTSGGNYTDENGQQWVCDEVDFEKGVYVQRVGARTLNGTENWSAGSCGTSGMSRYVLADDKTTYKNIVKRCSHFKSVNNSAYNAKEDGLYYGHEAFIFDFAISTVKAADVSSWKNWLNSNPVEIHWQLTEPIETTLTTEQLAAYAALHTNYPNTTIFNDGGADMEMKYAADTKLYIDKKFAELAAAIVGNA